MKFKDTEYGDLTGQHYDGDINVSHNKLTSLEGAPKSVLGYFYCSNNNLKSLEGGPEEVGGVFFCYNNELENLLYAPKTAGEYTLRLL